MYYVLKEPARASERGTAERDEPVSDDISQESTTELTESPELTVETTEDHSQGNQEQQEANPFWGEVEKLTGPNVYKLIQPHLAKADTAARERVTQLNQSYGPWKAFAEQGVTPEHVQQALGVVQRLNSSPEEVYESLRSFLEREGRLPSGQELQQEVEENADEEEDPRDAQLKTLQEQQQQMMAFLQQREMAAQQSAAAAEAETWIESEVSRLKNSGGYSSEDMQEIIRIAAFQAQTSGKDPENLDAAAAQFNALRDRIRTTQRPGQSAPRLPSGPMGGSPSGGPVDPSSMSKNDRQALVAEMLQRGK